MSVRPVPGFKLVLLVVAIATAWLPLVSTFAQRAQTPLEIGDMGHTVVNDRSVIVIALSNAGQTDLDASGEFTLVDAEGAEVTQVAVSTGEIAAREESVIAIPLTTLLAPGRYTATLTLADDDQNVRANSGLREISIGGFGPEPTPQLPSPPSPLQVEDGGENTGFPSWILLAIGLSLTVVGISYMRSSPEQKTPSSRRALPEVSMVRKVKVDSRPVKRPAKIKPLLPPRRRQK